MYAAEHQRALKPVPFKAITTICRYIPLWLDTLILKEEGFSREFSEYFYRIHFSIIE